jgi:hypothetical protein
MTTAHRPQADGKAERSNRTVQTVLRAFVNDHGTDWDDPAKLSLIELGLNSSTATASGVSPFLAVQGYTPNLPTTMLASSAATPGAEVTAADDKLRQLQRLWGQVSDKIRASQEKQAEFADGRLKPSEPAFQPGQQVWLHTRNYPSLRQSKLHPVYVGPYRIKSVPSAATVELELPPSMRIHPVVNVDILKPAHTAPDAPAAPGPVRISNRGDPLFELDHIVARRKIRGKTKYLVRWKGYGPADDTWEPASKMAKFPILLGQFRAQLPIARRVPRAEAG